MEFEVLDLGLTRYENAHAKQLELLKKRIAGEIHDTLILTEHHKVFTLGKTGHISNILVPKEKLEKENIEVVNVERGGDITYHGPGQLVAYPIFFLPKGRRDLKSFLRLLEQSVIETAKTYQAKTCVIDGLTGVWESKTGEEHLMVWHGERKLTSMGLAFKNWVSFHGLALNVEADLTPFSYMNLCGLVGKRPVNLRDLTSASFTFNDVKNTLVEEIRKQVKDW
ncbi:lipoyl(octanoyl) transferase LipB [bacterium]|nr:lipoyl(octanoyl) transferase LipB [bacterium]